MNTTTHGSTHISVDVTAWSTGQRVELMDKIDAINANLAADGMQVRASTTPEVVIPESVASTGWTLDAYNQIMTVLLSKHFVQAAAIAEAIKNGSGYVSRDEVYALGKYPDTRSLKGFTRPVNRVTADLVDGGDLPEDAEDLLRPDYDPEVKAFQRARGFFVPMEVVKLALEQRGDTGGELAGPQSA